MRWRLVVIVAVVAAACSPGSTGPKLSKLDDLPPVSADDQGRIPDGTSTMATVPWELFIDEADPTKFHVNVSGHRVVDDLTASGEERGATTTLRQRTVLTDQFGVMVLYVTGQPEVTSARVLFVGGLTLSPVPVIPAGDGWYFVIGSDASHDLAGLHLLDVDGRVVQVHAGLPESIW